MNTRPIEFNPKTTNIKEFIEKYNNVHQYIMGKNSLGEDTLMSINYDNVSVRTYQNNHHIRTNIYYEDGTIDEVFEGLW